MNNREMEQIVVAWLKLASLFEFRPAEIHSIPYAFSFSGELDLTPISCPVFPTPS